MKRLLPYVCLALLALLTGLAALVIGGITPFGPDSLCWQDNGQQVASDFGYVRGVWEGRHALDWSFACGGSPRSAFHPTFNNLCSPLTWAVAAIPGLSAVTGLSLLFLLQFTLLPLGALFYLRRRFPRLPQPLAMALALAYACGGFVLSMHSFLPFLNVALLFPWYVAALDALLRRGKWLPYCLLLAFMLAVGTYFAWMWLLFTAVYAAVRTGWRWTQSPIRQHTLLLFAASAVALLLSSFSWLPSLIVTALSARAGEAHWLWNATRAEVELSALVHIFSLPLVLAVIPAFRRPRCSRYLLALLVLAVGLFSVSSTTLWHLSRPWDFAGRFGYMADFMLICIGAEAGQRLRRPGRYALPFVLAGGTLLLAYSFFVHRELGSGTYQASAERIRIAEWAAQQVPQPEGRVKSRGHAAVENIAFFTPFDSLSHFTACIDKLQEATLAQWGYQQRAAVISTEGGSLATDTLLGIRYTLSQAADGEPYELEENPYYFGIGLMLPEGVFPLQGGDPIARQQELLTKLLGPEHAGTRRTGRVGQPAMLPGEFPHCLHYLQQPAVGGTILFGGHSYARWGEVETPPRLWAMPEGCRWLGGRIEKDVEYDIWHLPRTSLEALKRYGQELPVHTEYAGRCMRIHCRSTEERSVLFLPLLWQNLYRVRIDGEPACMRFLGGFVGLAMPAPGEHLVELEYQPIDASWFSLSGLFSLVALLLIRLRRASPSLASQSLLNTLCRHLLLALSFVLLLWPLLTLPIGLLWR